MNRKTFCSKNNYRNRPDIVDKEAQILACPVSVVEFENIPKKDTQKAKSLLITKIRALTKSLNRALKTI